MVQWRGEKEEGLATICQKVREEEEKPKIKSCLMVHKTRRKENGKVQAEKTKVKKGMGKKKSFR